ncbi:MAG: hypothetical protein H0V04_03905 [Chloroflexi bacterium]|nr:hypothetical protein [Chloroflexota bacterium]
MRCLEKDPADRPASAHEVADELADIEDRLVATGGAALIPVTDLGQAPTTAFAMDRGGQIDGFAHAAPDRTVAYRPGVVLGARQRRTSERRRGAGILGPLVLGGLLALVVVAFLAFGFGRLPFTGGGGDPSATPSDPGAGAIVFPTASSPAATIVTAAPTSPPTASPAPIIVPSPAPVPTAVPTVAPNPVPTLEPTPEPTKKPKPTREPRPTPEPPPDPTPEPPPDPTPEPPPESVTVALPNQLFEGGFERGDRRYHGRTVSYVYGQGTPYHTMTAQFALDPPVRTQGTAMLQLVGIDSEEEEKNPMRIVLNGVVIFEGPNPMPNDFCCGSSGPGNWGTVTFRFSSELLARNNELSITNLDPGDCTYCPNFIMIDKGELTYRTPG